MGESHHHYHQQAAAPSSRLGIRCVGGGGGDIVEVQGGHIVRSIGRKDRHSKVCTAKGPRDRRVRLSAHTAIQFYDVQDRLGYDRPSKAVDWLIKKAKTAIDELAELPPWTPTSTIATAITASAPSMHQEEEEENEFRVHGMVDSITKRATAEAATMVDGDNVRIIHSNSSSFLPPSLDSDSIADTIKSFFPIGAVAETPSSSMQFQNYPPDLLSRTSSQSQDLRLSLQSFQDPILLHHHQQAQNQNQATQQQSEYVLFSGNGTVGFDGCSGGWPHHHQRLVGWNAGGGADTGNNGGGSGGGFMFHAPPTQTFQPPLQPLFGHNQFFFSQRGPLQSSNTPSIRAWMDPSISASNHQNHQIQQPIHQSSISGIGYASGGFSGFQIPARIQGEEEHDGGISNKPPSASSDSRR